MTFELQRARPAGLVFDGFRRQSPRGFRDVPNTVRHVVYKCEEVFVDLLIGPLNNSGALS